MGLPATPQIIGRYAVFDKIASGGMASVHLGRLVGSAGFSRTVAVKRLHPHLAGEPEFFSTLIDEARLAARIHHPNVVPTLDVVADGEELLLVMEYVRGESLARLLRTEFTAGRRVPLPVASAIVVGALHGLHAAHEATGDRGVPLGIVHRDVSPQNILVGIDGVARVIDFGVAKAAGRLQTTRDGVLKGKMAYMAPEQLRGSEMTRRVDVYAMAVVLWETLTGKRLFAADTDATLFGLVLAGVRDAPSRYSPEIPPELDELVMRGLALEPGARFATAFEMAEALARLVPPALPPVVGAWVSRVAQQSLAKHDELLSDIESGSSTLTVAKAPTDPASGTTRASGARRIPAAPADDEAPTIASQPSSISLETPRRSIPAGKRDGQAWIAIGVVLGLVVAAGLLTVAVVRTRMSATGDPAQAASSAQLQDPAAPQAPATAPAPDPTVAASASAAALAPSSESATPPTSPSARPSWTAPRSSTRPTATPTALPPKPTPKNGIPADWN